MSGFRIPASDKDLFEKAQGASPPANFFLEHCVPDWSSWREHLDDQSLLRSAEGLAMLRLLALRATGAQPKAGWRFAQAWVHFLVSEESSSRNFFLQEYRAKDATFYDAEGLRVRQEIPPGWAGLFPKLRTSSLTVPEMELALVLFEWRGPEEKPILAQWLREHPHILWRVHRFLLARYCFALLRPFRRALKASRRRSGKSPHRSLYAPPFRAGEFLTLYPRIAGLVAIGFLGLMEVDLAQVLFFATSRIAALAAGGASITLLFLLNYMDVYKQNRGAMSDRRHGVGRALSLLGRFLGWGAILALLYVYLVHLSGNAQASAIQDWPSSQGPLNGLWNLLIPKVPAWKEIQGAPCSPTSWEMMARLGSGLFAMATSSCLLGALLQWFFEDTAATEPI
jgi:hypothetical protein